MRKICKTFCCCFMCCKCCKKPDYINEISNTTLLLPKNDTNRNKVLDQNKLHLFGCIYPGSQNIILNYSKSAIKKITSGLEHCLLLFNDGKLFGLGKNNYGQLGQKITIEGNIYDKLSPIAIDLNHIPEYKNSPIEIIDIACGDKVSHVLVKVKTNTILLKFGISEKDIYRDDVESITVIVSLFPYYIFLF